MKASLADRLIDAPRLAAPAQARRRLAALIGAPEAADLSELVSRRQARDLLLGLADHSPYLWRLIAEDPGRLARLLRAPPEESLKRIVAALHARRDDDEGEAMRALRRAKANRRC